MKARYGSLAFALLFATGSAWADDDEPREDPWAYDQDKSEKREKADKEEKELDDERSFGNSGDFAVSAERLVGIAKTTWRIKQTGTDPKGSVTRVHLLLNENGDVRSYSAPRIAFDWFAMDGLSLGGALGYSSESDSETGGASQHQTLIAPRVGYALMFSELIGVWPRAGITYQDQKLATAKSALLAGSVEAELVLVPTANVLVTLGPSFDFGIIGKNNPDGAPKKTDMAQDEFGFSAGIGMYF